MLTPVFTSSDAPSDEHENLFAASGSMYCHIWFQKELKGRQVKNSVTVKVIM